MRAVVFDFYGTLTDPAGERTRNVGRAVTAYALGIDPDTFRAAMSASFDERATGRLGGTVDALAAVARRCGVDPTPDQLAEAVSAHLDASRTVQTPRPEAAEVLGSLRDQGYLIGLLSDCTSELPELWSEHPLAPLVHAAVFSYDLGVRKPDPRGYRAVAELLEVPTEACWFVGDGGSSELTGAAAVGMRPILLLTDATSAGGTEHRIDPDTFPVSHAVASLVQLPALAAQDPAAERDAWILAATLNEPDPPR